MTSNTLNAFRYALLIALGGFVFGFDASVIGGVVGYVSSQFDLAPWQVGTVVSIPTLAAVLASLTIGWLSDLWGRRPVLLALAALYVISATASMLATGFVSLAVARGIGGYAFGALALAPVYIAELSPAHLRGRMVAINQMTIVVGISAAYFSNLWVQTMAGSGAAWTVGTGLAAEPWRWMLGMELLPALAWLLALMTVPESPRWLATKSRWESARQVLDSILPKAEIDIAIAEMRGLIEAAKAAGQSRFADLLSKRIRFALLIGFIIAVIQQITGINTVFFYATTIFEQSGVGTNAAFAQAVLVGLINVTFTIIAMALIDRLGRRPLMLIGLVGVTVSLAVVAWGFGTATYVLGANDLSALPAELNASLLQPLVGTVYDSDVAFKTAVAQLVGDAALRDHQAALLNAAMTGNPKLILAGILGFVASFALSLGPVMWVFLSEIFPNRVRGVAICMITVFNSGTSWLVQFLFPIQLGTMGISGVFAVYAGFGLLGLVLVARLMPETRQLSLEEIERQMAARAGAPIDEGAGGSR